MPSITVSGVITGEIKMWGAPFIPDGFLACDGAAVSRTTYSTLFSIYGTTFGSGDGSTTFNLPDLRGRVPIGIGTGPGLTNRNLGEQIGSETHALSASELAPHTHQYFSPTVIGSFFTEGGGPTASTIGIVSTQTGSSGSGTPHTNMQPGLGINFIIKT